jgi:hypothetical protein
MIDRRAFIVGGVAVLATSPGTGAERTEKVYRVGYLASSPRSGAEMFRHALGEFGWVDGRTFSLRPGTLTVGVKSYHNLPQSSFSGASTSSSRWARITSPQ